MGALQLLPAVDVVQGRAVRLVQGEAGTEHDYGDPAQAVARFVQAGAQWVHVVDLDAAFDRGSNDELLARIVASVQGAKIELSGGIRDTAALERALDVGASRVNIGTAALENPQWTAQMIETYGSQVAVGIDVRGEDVATHGWVHSAGNLWETLARFDDVGCQRYVITDVTRDGTLMGPNLDLLERVCAVTPAHVVASGGVSNLADIRALRELVPVGVEGVIMGKALYAGAFTLEEAFAAAQDS
ncbi:MAG: bifunctional 1-(5-phosphoribosyl)-5-((5-phosphoribosylamino)methylideneamino)imidazole-4-carboxamide isomerase/phosphoribosylanthranilate isomerase PriA [Actinomycetaceae bacterium]|nr:bifunctional 1-(5-phosphoribosyl)-5-((5-phosphoribosylamino)methylideneamino)imidazole-4-carboxamide isomerase/phosphoribosylanthranilate isomerase PriA [Arcanobacterium sp.]MDD7687270.1 bifunctional 1-(5-phosphoribosyl)-5-((5-phosphoribosylamino)methylideneamino)imidazole-4-carboxamide isomerase/phosphoribosylanthranilate isomerase PriA [Actinomycetaceae bacterium]MDY5273548.1 bifunctional 1-(5-phosphoribosyl)-5-((5-phosphoribosylamino)methylideneamino)imidazole-4-carboxamide isomerase/phosph